nr:MAG TPA: Fumarate reductase flavoprotein subunit [Caudoviricetes sp.]
MIRIYWSCRRHHYCSSPYRRISSNCSILNYFNNLVHLLL